MYMLPKPTDDHTKNTDGAVAIIGQSVSSCPDRVKDEQLPAPPKGLFGWRVELRDFRVRFLRFRFVVLSVGLSVRPCDDDGDNVDRAPSIPSHLL